MAHPPGLWKLDGVPLDTTPTPQESAARVRADELAERAHLLARQHLELAARRIEDASRAAHLAAAELASDKDAYGERRACTSLRLLLTELQCILHDRAEIRGQRAANQSLASSH